MDCRLSNSGRISNGSPSRAPLAAGRSIVWQHSKGLQGPAKLSEACRARRNGSRVAASPTLAAPPAATQSPNDAAFFVMDESVDFWSGFDWGFAKDENRRAVIDAAIKAASQDATAAAYWAYHFARYNFFVATGISALLLHRSVGVSSTALDQPRSGQQGPRRSDVLGQLNEEYYTRMADCCGTWMQDYSNIEGGVYKLPWDMVTPNKQFNPAYLASRTSLFLQEAMVTLDRTRLGPRLRPSDAVWLHSPSTYPQYYKTFHFQTDGWLSDRSANNYEHSTETLFAGRQDAMQRSALVPLSSFIQSSSTPPSEMRLLEVAAGTGRFHTFIKDNWPDILSVVSDLSPFYLQRARNNIKEWKRLRQPNKWLGGTDGAGVEYMQMAAEKLDVPDHSFDMVVCVYLFHELPEPVRRKAVAEWFRVLKPGGLCVLTDSMQLGDRPELDKGVEQFGDFNEPFFVNYVSCDLGAMFSDVGFAPRTKYMISATKTLSFYKPYQG